MSLAEIARFHDVHEAGVAVSFLRANGVAAEVVDHNLATIDPLMQRAMGGIRVLGPVGEAAEARRLLDQVAAGDHAAPDEGNVSPAIPSRRLTAGVLGALVIAGDSAGLAVSGLARRPSTWVSRLGQAVVFVHLVWMLILFMG
jgi:hypothetical protein